MANEAIRLAMLLGNVSPRKISGQSKIWVVNFKERQSQGKDKICYSKHNKLAIINLAHNSNYQWSMMNECKI